jgi:hypothetical protein
MKEARPNPKDVTAEQPHIAAEGIKTFDLYSS